MAYDEQLAERIRKRLAKRKGVVEKKMFGGIAFLLNGHMSCGVFKDTMIVRLPPEESDAALAEPHTGVFDFTGRPMKGWIVVQPKGLATGAQLGKWIERSSRHAASKPPK
jgi:TfoX/Sxy family transcriptional regulator of competence genes